MTSFVLNKLCELGSSGSLEPLLLILLFISVLIGLFVTPLFIFRLLLKYFKKINKVDDLLEHDTSSYDSDSTSNTDSTK